MYKSRIKTAVKKLITAIEKKETENIESLFKNALKEINKARSKGVIHRNTAARKISRLYGKVNSYLNQSQQES